MEQMGSDGPSGMELHVLFGDEPNMRIREIWASEEQWRDAFENAIKPAVASVGGDTGPEPEILPVHNVFDPSKAPAA
jgi:hypothetical protein